MEMKKRKKKIKLVSREMSFKKDSYLYGQNHKWYITFSCPTLNDLRGQYYQVPKKL